MILLTELVYYVFTLMAPVVLVRYHLILFYFFPVVIAALFIKVGEPEMNKEIYKEKALEGSDARKSRRDAFLRKRRQVTGFLIRNCSAG